MYNCMSIYKYIVHLLAREMVVAVASASCWHFSFSAVACSNWLVSSARLSSNSCYMYSHHINVHVYIVYMAHKNSVSKCNV